MNWIVENYQAAFAIFGQIVAVASAIVVLTPSTKDDEVLGKIVKFLELFSVVSKKTNA